ncbi:hypothetical protein K1719_007527 [Acacia pycnantha]|nr:hypothetical protein K1719_007527 [Acacia pycnantha]
MLNLNVGETGEGDCDDVGRDDDDDFDSDYDSYMELSESECSDSEVSLEDDYEIDEDPDDRASDEDEGNLGLNDDSWPLQERIPVFALIIPEDNWSAKISAKLLSAVILNAIWLYLLPIFPEHIVSILVVFIQEFCSALCLLTACAHGGLVKEAWFFFESLRKFGMAPTSEHYACMVDVLARASHLATAYQFICEMPIEPTASMLGALLNGCINHRKFDLAETVGKKLIERSHGKKRCEKIPRVQLCGTIWGPS